MSASEQARSLGELDAARLTEALMRRIGDIPHRIAWSLSPESTHHNRARLEAFRNRHVGQRCVIVASGPSLMRTNLSLIDGTTVIGMNRVDVLEQTTGIRVDYAVAMDIDTKLAQFPREFDSLTMPCFFNWNARSLFHRRETLMFLKESSRRRFVADATRVLGSGSSVTFTCLQLAFFMGFADVVLIGKDHDYGVAGRPHKVVKASATSDHWFSKNYQGEGTAFRVPDLLGEEHAYRQARHAYEVAGRRIIDATVDGKLRVFEKAELSTLFSDAGKR